MDEGDRWMKMRMGKGWIRVRVDEGDEWIRVKSG